jgi:hypothetical protein
VITRIWSRIRRRRRWTEPDTLTRLPVIRAEVNLGSTEVAAPVEPGPDELAVRAALLRLLGAGGPR